MKTCTKCNISYADDKKFCKKCGSPLSQEYNIDPKDLAKKNVFEDKLKTDPLNIEVLHEYTQFLFDNLLLKKTIPVALKILAINENDEQAKDLLFKSYVKLNMYKEASQMAAQLLESKTTDVFFLEEVANIETKLGNNAKAIEYYEVILKIQPANTKALYNKAIIFLENKELEKALNIFKELHKNGDRDRITIIYTGINKCLTGKYEEAIEILTPHLSKKDVSLNNVDNQRGFIYLIYCLCKTQSPINKIDEWFSLLDFQILKNSLQPLDEEILAKSVREIINIYFSNDKQDIDPNSINYAIDRYISKPSLCFTNHTKNILAEIWADVSELQKGVELFSDAQDSLKKATELSPDNTEYANKLIEATALYKKRKKRKSVIITGSVFTIAVLIILSVKLYNSYKENKAWEVAKQENTYESYDDYLKRYPDNEFSEEAEYLKEEVLWGKVKDKNTLESYDKYLDKYWKHQGRYVQDATDSKEKLLGKYAFTDKRDGETYKAVKIGNQIWMAENLKTTKYKDGTTIPLVTNNSTWSRLTTPAYCWYKNDAAAYKNIYGALYNWYTVNTGKLCPTGWHVPTDAEWTTLINYLGGEYKAGVKLRETGTTHWKARNTGVTNETGFTALPGGYRKANGRSMNISYYGYWWSATESNATFAWRRNMYYYYSHVHRNPSDKELGFSVRCVRD